MKSEQPDPTLYVSWLPQYAEEFKKQGKGIAFIGSSFIVGVFGDPSSIQLETLQKIAAEQSSKPIKTMQKDKVTFKFKEKGRQPINATGVCQFMISGANMNIEKLAETLEAMGIANMDGETNEEKDVSKKESVSKEEKKEEVKKEEVQKEEVKKEEVKQEGKKEGKKQKKGRK